MIVRQWTQWHAAFELTGTMGRETMADALMDVRAAGVTAPVRASVRTGAAPNLARQCDRPTERDRSHDRGWRLRRFEPPADAGGQAPRWPSLFLLALGFKTSPRADRGRMAVPDQAWLSWYQNVRKPCEIASGPAKRAHSNR